jgi:hypothetical protein
VSKVKDTLYNLDLACTNDTELAPPSKYFFYYLQSNGTFSQGNPGTSISAAALIPANGLPCNLGTHSGTLPFNGILWINYSVKNMPLPPIAEVNVYVNSKFPIP